MIGALVDIPEPGAEGVLFAQGSRFGGHALYIKDNRLHYVNSFVGSVEQTVVGSKDVPTGKNLILSASFEKESQETDRDSGTVTLFHGEEKVGEARIETQLGAFAIAGSSLFVGRHEGEVITDDYPVRRRTASPAGRSTGSRSTSAASRTSISSAKLPDADARIARTGGVRRLQGVGRPPVVRSCQMATNEKRQGGAAAQAARSSG